MTKILCIETSEKICSVALSENGHCTEEINNYEEQSHAKRLTIMIQEILDKRDFSFSDLDAIAVSSGPGSYTGLRIGVSVAKGICWAKDLPLISVNTLDTLLDNQKTEKPHFDVYISSIDARRNEVFMKALSKENKVLIDTQPVILDENPLNQFEGQSCLILGSGADKFEVHKRSNDLLDGVIRPIAKYLCPIAQEKYDLKIFEDVAYFEPTYFKPVHTTVSKKKLFGV